MSSTQFITSPPFSLKPPNSLLFFSTTTSTIHTHKTLTLPFSFRTCTNSQSFSTRRLFLPSVSGIWDAITGGGNNPREAVAAIRGGMVLFRQGDVLGSVAEFDKAIELDPRQKAYLWQRGLSLYYLDRFEEGAEQFRIDVAHNPNDTEESIWCFLCEAQLYGINEAREQFLEVGRDPRPVMREAYNMFKDGGDPEKLAAAFKNGRDSDYFYASLYAGLYYEAQVTEELCVELHFTRGSSISRRTMTSQCWSEGDLMKKPDEAKLHILAAYQSPYGQRSDDYMASLAKVHCLCRNWRSD